MSEPRTSDELRSPAEVKSIEAAITGILEGFSWMHSPQGHDYWQHVVNNLAALIGRDPGDY
jgi:hypothetical protein